MVKRTSRTKKTFESIQKQYDSIEDQIAKLMQQQEAMKEQQRELAMETVMDVFPEIASGEFEGTLRDFLLEVRAAWEGTEEADEDEDEAEDEEDEREDVKPAFGGSDKAPANPFGV